MNTLRLKLAIPLLIALGYSASPAWAMPILGPNLTNFAVLGATTVTNTGPTTLNGLLGLDPGSSITGQDTITINGQPALTTGARYVHIDDSAAASAQGQLTAARNYLSSMGVGTTLSSSNLAGLILTPGVYTLPAGGNNLTGILTLNGEGNANAKWVFQMPSTLITSAGSAVNMINTGSGAGVYWNVGSSATLGTTTAFKGNILALTSITLDQGATIMDGRALANTGAVTMDANIISAVPASIVSSVPEPAPYTMMLVGLGLVGLVARRKTAAKP
ncbi:MAG: ice-binding family protein [Sulfuriferula sp.]